MDLGPLFLSDSSNNIYVQGGSAFSYTWNGRESAIENSDNGVSLSVGVLVCPYCRIANPKEQVSYCLACGAPHIVSEFIMPFNTSFDVDAWYNQKIDSAKDRIKRIKNGV